MGKLDIDSASFLLVGSLIIGAAATIAMVWMGIVKEHHWDLARELAATKINEEGEEVERLHSANLALEAKIRPRRLAGEDSLKLTAALSKMKPLSIGIVSRLFDPEGATWRTIFPKRLAMPIGNRSGRKIGPCPTGGRHSYADWDGDPARSLRWLDFGSRGHRH
jgi:hypothetical protein